MRSSPWSNGSTPEEVRHDRLAPAHPGAAPQGVPPDLAGPEHVPDGRRAAAAAPVHLRDRSVARSPPGAGGGGGRAAHTGGDEPSGRLPELSVLHRPRGAPPGRGGGRAGGRPAL